MIRRPFQLLLPFALVAACSLSSTAPAALVSGTYELRVYNGISVPVDFGVLPPKGSNPTECHFHLTAGSLVIDVPRSSFAYSYEVRNACDQHLLSNPRVDGVFSQRGGSITFRVPRVDDTVIEFAGTRTGAGIAVANGDERFLFRR